MGQLKSNSRRVKAHELNRCGRLALILSGNGSTMLMSNSGKRFRKYQTIKNCILDGGCLTLEPDHECRCDLCDDFSERAEFRSMLGVQTLMTAIIPRRFRKP
jgi:hypothetical protein